MTCCLSRTRTRRAKGLWVANAAASRPRLHVVSLVSLHPTMRLLVCLPPQHMTSEDDVSGWRRHPPPTQSTPIRTTKATTRETTTHASSPIRVITVKRIDLSGMYDDGTQDAPSSSSPSFPNGNTIANDRGVSFSYKPLLETSGQHGEDVAPPIDYDGEVQRILARRMSRGLVGTPHHAISAPAAASTTRTTTTTIIEPPAASRRPQQPTIEELLRASPSRRRRNSNGNKTIPSTDAAFSRKGLVSSSSPPSRAANPSSASSPGSSPSRFSPATAVMTPEQRQRRLAEIRAQEMWAKAARRTASPSAAGGR